MRGIFVPSAIFVLAFVFILGANAPAVEAVTADWLRTQIGAIQQQIAQLYSQLGNIQSPGATATCHVSSPWSWNYCSESCKCDAGQGDCDKDSECNTGYCAKDVGANYGQGVYTDVCENRSGSVSDASDITASTTALILSNCVDTDGGHNVFKKGTATWYGHLYSDHCAGNSIVEYYCKSNMIFLDVESCIYGCQTGACIEQPSITVLSPKMDSW